MTVNINGKDVKIGELSVIYKPIKAEIYINSIEDAVVFFKHIWYPGLMNVQKLFYVLYLDNNLKVLCWHLLNTGAETSSKCDKKLIALTAINVCAKSILIAHNNTSGKLKPTSDDKLRLNEINQMLEVLNIHFMDYIIITEDSFTAMEI